MVLFFCFFFFFSFIQLVILENLSVLDLALSGVKELIIKIATSYKQYNKQTLHSTIWGSTKGLSLAASKSSNRFSFITLKGPLGCLRLQLIIDFIRYSVVLS